MDGRIGALILGMFAIAVLGVGCGAETTNTEARPPKNSPALSKHVAALNQGMSTESVKATLGEPLSERMVDEGDRIVDMLFYGNWQLLFDEGKLDKRVKYVLERPIPKASVEEREERTLDRRVLALRPGMSMVAIKSQLGVPDTYEIDRNDPKEEILYYESWSLTFIDGILRHRNSY